MAEGPDRILTERQLNRALLARQMLLERASYALPRALERMGTLQAQYAPSMYVGLWSRLEGFDRETLTRALERRKVVQGTMMRATIHLVSAADYWPLTEAIREGRRELYVRSLGKGGRTEITPKAMAAEARRLRRQLLKGPMRRKQIDELIGKGSPWTNGVNMWLDLLRVPPSGTWEERRAGLYALAEEWLGPAEVDPGDALDLLVKRYLTGYGPASRKEIANWAGLPPERIDPALERLRLRRFRSEDGEELLDLPRAPLPDPGTSAPVRFLPTWDAALLVHARRTGILAEKDRPRIFGTRTPQSKPTFTVDGVVAGSWSYEKGRVRLEPFRRLAKAARREAEDEAERLAAFHA